MARRGIPPLEERDPALAAELVRLYQTGLSCRAVAEKVDQVVSHETVYATVRKAGVVRQHGGWSCPGVVEYKGTSFRVRRYPVSLVLQVLRAYDRGTSTTTVADRHGLSVSQVEKWIAKAGINRSPRKASRLVVRARLGGISDGALADLKVRAEELYVGGASMREVGAELGLRYSTIYYWLRRRGVIRRRRRSPLARLAAAERERLMARAVELYVKRRMAAADVARHLSVTSNTPVSWQTVLTWVRNAGVMRSRSESLQLRYERDRHDLVAQVWALLGEGLSRAEIAARVGRHPATVRSIINTDRRPGRKAA